MRNSLMPWAPRVLGLATDLEDSWDDFDDFMNRVMTPIRNYRFNPGANERFSPAYDFDENETHYFLSFDLPGMKKEDIKIEITGDQLVVSGERKSEQREGRGSRTGTERYYGTFKRLFTLPTKIEADKVEADYRDGVLRVALPKVEDVKRHQIKISEGKSGIFSKLLGKSGEKEREVSTSSPQAS